jgi:hypothetical protein
MQLRHISPRSIDWVDAMDEGMGVRGWDRLAPEELTKLRASEQLARGVSVVVAGSETNDERAYGWGDGSASR